MDLDQNLRIDLDRTLRLGKIPTLLLLQRPDNDQWHYVRFRRFVMLLRERLFQRHTKIRLHLHDLYHICVEYYSLLLANDVVLSSLLQRPKQHKLVLERHKVRLQCQFSCLGNRLQTKRREIHWWEVQYTLLGLGRLQHLLHLLPRVLGLFYWLGFV